MAEIFSRYYDKDVRMHGFDNGTATRVKRDNWGQLTRFFKKARDKTVRKTSLQALYVPKGGLRAGRARVQNIVPLIDPTLVRIYRAPF